jgi:hypothetical protein
MSIETGTDFSWRPDLGWSDAFRWDSHRSTAPGFREWHHYCVVGADIDVLINFSILGAIGPRATTGQVAVLVRRDTWHGGVERLPVDGLDVSFGPLCASFGPGRVHYDGAYHVHLAPAEGRPSCDLHFQPVTRPFIAHNIDSSGATSLSWLVVPHLLVTGTVVVGGETHTFHDAPGYHDHNWGHWGIDSVWDWGFGLADAGETPCSVVFVRLLDRARAEVRVQGLFLWDGASLRRVFRDADLRFRSTGRLETPGLYKLPPVLRLLAPGTVTGVPERLEIGYDDPTDGGVVRFSSEAAAQIVAVQDRYPDLLEINEVSAHFEIEGMLGGRALVSRGRGIFEHVIAR